MKYRLYVFALALVAAPAIADKACRKDAQGEVHCEQIDDAAATKDSVTIDTEKAEADATRDRAEKASGGEVGDRTTQSREHGIKY